MTQQTNKQTKGAARAGSSLFAIADRKLRCAYHVKLRYYQHGHAHLITTTLNAARLVDVALWAYRYADKCGVFCYTYEITTNDAHVGVFNHFDILIG